MSPSACMSRRRRRRRIACTACICVRTKQQQTCTHFEKHALVHTYAVSHRQALVAAIVDPIIYVHMYHHHHHHHCTYVHGTVTHRHAYIRRSVAAFWALTIYR